MAHGRPARLSAAAAMFLVSLAHAAPSLGIEAPGIKVMNPSQQMSTNPSQVQTAPKVGPAGIGATGASGCVLTSVSPAAAEVGAEVVVTGQGLSVNCSVYFQNPAGGAYATGTQTVDPSHMKVVVPVMASGKGTIAVQARNSAIQGLQSASHVQPFEVKPTVPVLQSVSRPTALPGEQVNVYGSNLKQGEPYAAWVVSSTGKRVSAQLTWLTAASFRVTVPDMDQSYGTMEGTQFPNTIFITRGATPSNRLPLQVLPAPRCVLKSITPAAEFTGGYVTLNGSYMIPDCDVLFHSATGQVFPAASKHARDYGLSVQIPQMPGGKGFISAKPKEAAADGVRYPFEVKALTPLMAMRADQMDIQGFGQKIMSSGVPVKVYRSNISDPVIPPFDCQAWYEVYQNGAVYTYIYGFKVEEFAITQRYLRELRITWPDLNDGTLKYGVIKSKSDLEAGGAQYVKGETGPNEYFSIGGGGKKSFCVYLQSKRPPAQGTVYIDDFHAWPIFISDFRVPQR